MNKRQIIASLNNIANSLDNSGLYKEANALSSVMKKVAQQVPQTQQQLWGRGQQNESNYRNYKPLSDQFNKIYHEIFNNIDKISPIMTEIIRKIDSGIQLQQTQNGFNSIMMCNNLLHHNKTLQIQLQNVFNQILKLHNPFNSNDSLAISGYQKSIYGAQDQIYKWSETVNKYNSMIKLYQPMQTQQPAQQTAQVPSFTVSDVFRSLMADAGPQPKIEPNLVGLANLQKQMARK